MGKIRRLLRDLGYRPQGTVTVIEGSDHPDHDAQFTHIKTTVYNG